MFMGGEHDCKIFKGTVHLFIKCKFFFFLKHIFFLKIWYYYCFIMLLMEFMRLITIILLTPALVVNSIYSQVFLSPLWDIICICVFFMEFLLATVTYDIYCEKWLTNNWIKNISLKFIQRTSVISDLSVCKKTKTNTK